MRRQTTEVGSMRQSLGKSWHRTSTPGGRRQDGSAAFSKSEGRADVVLILLCRSFVVHLEEEGGLASSKLFSYAS